MIALHRSTLFLKHCSHIIFSYFRMIKLLCTQLNEFKRGFMTTRVKSNTTELSWHFWDCWCDLRTQPHHRTFEASSSVCVCAGGWRGSHYISTSHWDINASKIWTPALPHWNKNISALHNKQMDSWGRITAIIHQTELSIHRFINDMLCSE